MILGKENLEHLRNDVVYPATKKEIMEACNMMSDVPKEDVEWFQKNVPEYTFENSDEVIRTAEIVHRLGTVSYPISRKELIKEFSRISEVPKTYREWFERSLLDKTYSSLEDVLGVLRGVTLIKEHVSFPTTKNIIVKNIKGKMDVPSTDREFIERCLPDRNFGDISDVIKSC